ncbi:carbohydrate-binding module family 50 protein [Parathielavia appendiculata]|uniref:Carbohydrate-binding module family 50 protein n=1 Tax=Parathielavia appendiculata TaxID=2587402 RepID=A0AAN6U380_9PEZI|nr:carbohydrate-binding module family 50 protein [Parathielavia appendiculata]
MVAARVLLRRGVDCLCYETAGSGVTCETIARAWGLTVDGFEKLNPGFTCPDLEVNKPYCVMGTVTPDPSSTTTITSRTASTTTSTSTPSNTATPSPVQDGMVANRNRFHFVQQGHTCATIATLYSISSDCTGLWASTYACVGVVGVNPTPTTTKPGNGITTPTPAHPGMVSNCNKFVYNNVGGGQWVKLWNGIEEDCRSIQAHTYVCIGVIGGTPTPTRTRSGNGITTPTPAHPGMVSNCNKFVYVNPGDTCDGIAFWSGVAGGQYVKL